ncbi:hypothetical protein, partial [Paenibacillus agri]|uniref:hypothetical protein n=1 Tax=Paenibacillus agri TaxID=2744309 RepID=UPI001C30A148
ASGFLQIPPHGGHPCLWLTVGACQPPLGTFTLEMTPMLGVLNKEEQPYPAALLNTLKVVYRQIPLDTATVTT